LFIWIYFDNLTIQDGFDNVLTIKTFFQGVLHSMAFDEIIAVPYSLANDLNVQTCCPV